jgi:hypothetical protein
MALSPDPARHGFFHGTSACLSALFAAIALANRTPTDPRTLTRAARDFADENSSFAVEAGMAALRVLVMGYGYDITGADVWAAYSHTMKAAERRGSAAATRQRICALVSSETFGERFVTKILGRELGLSRK